MRPRLPVACALVLIGVTVALAQDDVRNYRGGSTKAAQSQAASQSPLPSPTPCHFGPITKRITADDVGEIIRTSPTRRAAWSFILARPEDEGAEPFVGLILYAPDDGLGDGLVCPIESP